MSGMQKAELFRHEEQEESDRQAGSEEVLQVLQQAYEPQGNKGVGSR